MLIGRGRNPPSESMGGMSNRNLMVPNPPGLGKFANMNVGSVKHMRSGNKIASFGSKRNTPIAQPQMGNKNLVPHNLQRFEEDNEEQFFEEEEEDNLQRANIPL